MVKGEHVHFVNIVYVCDASNNPRRPGIACLVKKEKAKDDEEGRRKEKLVE